MGRVRSFEELDRLQERFHVLRCVVDPQADPHRVYEWSRATAHGAIYRVVYLSDGISKPVWDNENRIVTVDRTYALDAAYDDIEEGRWWLTPGAGEIDDGEFYAQMKAPKRERDLSTGQLRYRWSDTGALEHYRQAQAFDHLASFYPPMKVYLI